MQVRELVTPLPVLAEGAPAADVRAALRMARAPWLPVCDAAGRLLGGVRRGPGGDPDGAAPLAGLVPLQTVPADADPAALPDCREPLAVVDDAGRWVGALWPSAVRMAKENARLEGERRELEAVLNACYDSIYVADRDGTILRVTAGSERLSGWKPSEIVGRNVRDMEREGRFSPSVIRMVLEQGGPQTIIQTMNSGKRLISSAMPVRGPDGEVERVVAVSRDVSALVDDVLQREGLKQEHANLLRRIEELNLLQERYKAELAELRRRQTPLPELIAASPASDRLREMVHRVAATDATVLVTGESGVGKNLVAKAIHELSRRAREPFVEVSCGALSDTLLESELFGYMPGAFTGANPKGKPGLIEVANGGTLFLDEIGEMPLSLQPKLLRVLQQKEIVRVGGVKPVPVDIRVVAATNRDLQAMVAEGTFRRDLFYRLNVVPIAVPPLRERKEDILPLVAHFLHKFGQVHGQVRSISPAALDILLSYGWPGNVRELINLLERLVITAAGDVISPRDLPAEMVSSAADAVGALREQVDSYELRILQEAVAQHGSLGKAAAALGVHKSTLLRKLQRVSRRS